MILLLIILSGCGQASSSPPTTTPAGSGNAATAKPIILASIYPVASLLKQMTGDWADVQTLLPPDASPHSFDLTPRQLHQVASAQVLVVVGMNLDNWALKAAHEAGNKNLAVFKFSQLAGLEKPPTKGQLSLPSQQDQTPSPEQPEPDDLASNEHLWLDPMLTARFVTALAQQLKQVYPEHDKAIVAAAAMLRDKALQVDSDYRYELRGLPHRNMVTFHDAFDRIAARYGLIVAVHLTVGEPGPGAEITPDRLQSAIAAIRVNHLKVVYIEPQFSQRVLQPILRATGAKVVLLDPMGGPDRKGYETWQAMMESNLKTLVAGQSR